jgi:flagellar motor switch protein FliG
MSSPISISSFADIVDLDDDQIREIYARVGRDDLTVALKAATEALKDRVLSCLSEADGEALCSYMEWLGPMLLAEVEVMQLQIVRKFRGEPGDEAYV